jgi:S-adenosylmethionine:tRNA ribosyltransferase-isomerase
MRTDLFDYDLPPEFIAQQPAEPRDSSRLLVLHRATGRIEHRRFYEIGEYLRSGDLLIANDSRVIPARLHGRKATGGQVELFLLNPVDDAGLRWACLTRGRNVREGLEISLIDGMGTATDLVAIVEAVHADGTRQVRFSAPMMPYLEALGEIPLPPYITDYAGDRERYQTIYSRPEGSVAAPTAGLHFTPELLLDLRRAGIGFDTVTLHVGLDTFKPVEVEEIGDHVIHSEWAELTRDTARHINDVTLQGGRVVAVGTTATRTLEYAATGAQGIDPYDNTACPWQRTAAFAGPVDLYIRPGYRFRAVDVLLTNFHLPRSSLLLLVSAFVGQAHPDDLDAGRRILLDAYEEAKREGYRFYSFGDAMLIV